MPVSCGCEYTIGVEPSWGRLRFAPLADAFDGVGEGAELRAIDAALRYDIAAMCAVESGRASLVRGWWSGEELSAACPPVAAAGQGRREAGSEDQEGGRL